MGNAHTWALLDAVPVPDPSVEAGRKFRPVKGEVPSPINPPSGWCFIRVARSRSPAAAGSVRTSERWVPATGWPAARCVRFIERERLRAQHRRTLRRK